MAWNLVMSCRLDNILLVLLIVKPACGQTTPNFINGTQGISDIHAKENGNSYKMPSKWNKFCYMDNTTYMESKFTRRTQLTTIKCNVTRDFSGVWNMADLRISLEDFRDTTLAVNVDIECDNLSVISLSHPMQVYKLYKLSVRGCNVTDHYADQYNTVLDTMPDSLRQLDLRDNNFYLFEGVFNYNPQNMSKKFTCVHSETIESWTNNNNILELYRNNSYRHSTSLEKPIPHCTYDHLMKLDRSNIGYRTRNYIRDMTSHNDYSELLVFNFSHNSVNSAEVGDQLLNLSSLFPKLELLDLSHNMITKIHRFSVNNVSTMVRINIQYNNISTITVDDLELFLNNPAVFIDVRNNLFDCTCSEEMKNVLQYITDNQHHLQIRNYNYVGELQCVKPERFAGRTLASPDVCTQEVKKDYSLLQAMFVSLSIVIVVTIIVSIVRCQQNIMIFLFTNCNIIVPCYSKVGFDTSKKFDAFVSYSSSEERRVETIFEDLEKSGKSRAPFKFCLHHRDFVPGKTIFDNVVASIEASRHTIILLSNHFLNSQYCLLEFQEAFRQSIMEQKRHLVIIMMEDIPEEKLPRDLKRCIERFTYLRWNDYRFKDRLVYALSVKEGDPDTTPLVSYSNKNDFVV